MMQAANENTPEENELASQILQRMTPAEQAEADEEARAKGVTVERLILRAVDSLIDLEDRARASFTRSPRG